MNNRIIIKIATSLVIGTTILTSLSIQANAEWKQDNSGGWWYTECNSYVKGWKQINGKWYYFNNNGRMLFNRITPDGYVLNIDGSWDARTKELYASKSWILATKQKLYDIGTQKIDICIFNKTDNTLLFSPSYHIEKLENQQWIELPFNNVSFPEIIEEVGIGSNSEEKCDLTLLEDFANLTSGKYRVVKEINNENRYAEFELK